MNEVFKESILHGTIDATPGAPYPAGNLNNPWEILYGPDGFLWITEARGYTIRRLNPSTGAITTVLDIANGATGYLTPAEHTAYNRVFTATQNPWPQGGMMGLALHPDFMHPTTPKKYVYVGYVRTYDSTSVFTNGGVFFTSRLVRFTYNTVTNKLESPVSLCDTLRGSNDHNSGRIIIAPVGGVNYLFYSLGDMGAGQYGNKQRAIKAQNPASYEGKILRFNLEPDGDAGTFDRWIPSGTGTNNNPFNGATQSAVYTTGVRNNQGFAYNSATNLLYGSEHGQFSDDEINIIEMGKNYGHPLVEGYNDGNYNNAKAGSASGILPFITSEAANATAIGVNFRQSMYTLYPAPNGPSGTPNAILTIYNSTTGDPGGNNTWYSVAQSGLDIYTSSFIPGWRNSLLTAAMKKAKFFRLQLNGAGTNVMATPAGSASPTNDTVGVFYSQNRYRDLAISPDGKTIYAAIDRDGTSSGPTAGSPQPSQCPGCIKKFEFLGYNDNAGVSMIPVSIPIGAGINNANTNGTPTVINADNNNLWVPITDSLGNIIAEIDANGNNLGTITTLLYKNSGIIRTTGSGKPYLDRSITITPQNQPASAVNIRLYLTAVELAALVAAPGSGVTGINDINIFKNNDPNSSVAINTTTTIVPTARTTFGSDYVITANITSFSSFYFASDLGTLPLTLLSFTGKYINQEAQLRWETENEVNTSTFIVERSADGRSFERIGSVSASGNTYGIKKSYTYTDRTISLQSNATFYYRLKMIDRDGTFKYSSIIFITLSDITGRITIIPNPVVSGSDVKVNMVAPVDGTVQWKLIDNNGRTLLQNKLHVRKGNNNLTIKIDRLPAGIYYLNISGAGLDEKVKLQKL